MSFDIKKDLYENVHHSVSKLGKLYDYSNLPGLVLNNRKSGVTKEDVNKAIAELIGEGLIVPVFNLIGDDSNVACQIFLDLSHTEKQLLA
jgi:hypothetical protein